MGNFLNLVYDKWNGNIPLPNGIKHKYDLDTDNTFMTPYLDVYDRIKHFTDFGNILRCKIEDIAKKPEENFFYAVWYRHNLVHRWLSEDKLPISDEIIDVIRKNSNLYLLFLNEEEYEPKESFLHLNKICNEKNINPKQIWLLSNNSRLEEFKEYYKSDINVHITSSLTRVMKHDPMINFKPIKDKGSFFLCHNRTPKLHRYAILILLKKYGILDDVNWSLINGSQFNKNKEEFFKIFKRETMYIVQKEIDYFFSFDMQKSKYEQHRTEFDIKDQQHIFSEPETYENSYFNITTESVYFGDDIHITEKSIKPFYYLQFPLILASYQHIEYFKKKYAGLDFFEDVIDHSYDNIIDNRNRLIKFFEEIKRIYNNKEFFIDFYQKNEKRFINNRNKILSLKNDKDTEFFNSLITYGR